MPVWCVQCAMEDLLADRPVQVHDETIDQHMTRVHRDPVATQARRSELEKLLIKKLEQLPTDPRRI